MQSDNSMTTQKKEEIRLRKLEQERIQANLFKAVVDLKQEVNNPGEQNPETHLFVTPSKYTEATTNRILHFAGVKPHGT